MHIKIRTCINNSVPKSLEAMPPYGARVTAPNKFTWAVPYVWGFTSLRMGCCASRHRSLANTTVLLITLVCMYINPSVFIYCMYACMYRYMYVYVYSMFVICI